LIISKQYIFYRDGNKVITLNNIT